MNIPVLTSMFTDHEFIVIDKENTGKEVVEALRKLNPHLALEVHGVFIEEMLEKQEKEM